jgi:hypothetical protein
MISVGDLLRLGDRFWEVEGIHLGALKQESVIEIEVIGKSNPSAHGKTLDRMFIPQDMAYSCEIYTPYKTKSLKEGSRHE